VGTTLGSHKDIDFEDLDDFPIVNRGQSIFYKQILFVYLVRKLHMVDCIIFTCIILYMYRVELL
jgi:hypothetical protein